MKLLPEMLKVDLNETLDLMNVARGFPEWELARTTLGKMKEKIEEALKHE